MRDGIGSHRGTMMAARCSISLGGDGVRADCTFRLRPWTASNSGA
jgi:hypothetical protein